MISETAKPGIDYTVTAQSVTIADGQNRILLPIFIVNDNKPEFNETFIVRLLRKGDVLIGSPAECRVTIMKNDYPYGLIGMILAYVFFLLSEIYFLRSM